MWEQISEYGTIEAIRSSVQGEEDPHE